MNDALGEIGCQIGCQDTEQPDSEPQDLQNVSGKVVSRLGIVHVWRARRATPTRLGSRRAKPTHAKRGLVSLNFASWNQMAAWLRRVAAVQHAA